MVRGVHDIETMLGVYDVSTKTRENLKLGISEPSIKKQGKCEVMMSKHKNIETMCVYLDNLKGNVGQGGEHCLWEFLRVRKKNVCEGT